MQLTRGQGHFLQWGTCKQSQQQSYSLCWKGNWGLHSDSPPLAVLRQIPEEFRHTARVPVRGFCPALGQQPRCPLSYLQLLPISIFLLGKAKTNLWPAVLSCRYPRAASHESGYIPATSARSTALSNGIAGAVPKHCGMLASVNKTLSKGNIWAQRSIHTWYIPAPPQMQFSIAAAKEG